jgi:hypothetical protein
VREVFFDRRWDLQRIWALPTPASPKALADLEWHLGLPVWSTVPGEPRFDLSPSQVLAEPGAFPRHWTKVRAADLRHPLELFRHGARWVIVDGYHRLARAVLEGSPALLVRQHPDECWPHVEIP